MIDWKRPSRAQTRQMPNPFLTKLPVDIGFHLNDGAENYGEARDRR